MWKSFSRIIKNFSIYLWSSVIASAIPFLLMPFLTRILSPSDYGLIAMFGLLVSIFGAFVGVSVHGAVSVRYFEKGQESLAEYVGATMVVVMASLLIVVAITYFFIDRIYSLVPIPHPWIYLAAIAAALRFVINIRLALWRSMRKASNFGVMQVFQSGLDAGLTLTLVLLFGMKGDGRVAGQLIALFVIGIVSLSLLKRDRLLSWPSRLSADTSDALRFGLPLIPHVLGGIAAISVGRLVVANLLGIDAVGQYMVALQFGVLFSFVADAFGKAYSPWLYGVLTSPSEEDHLMVVGATYVIIVLFILTATLAAIFAYLFFPLFVGRQFLPAKQLVPLFILGGAFTGMYYSVSGLFFMTSRTKPIAIATVTSGLIGAALCLLLVRWIGIQGAALAYLVSQLLLFVIAWLLSMSVYPLPWFKLRASINALKFHFRGGQGIA